MFCSPVTESNRCMHSHIVRTSQFQTQYTSTQTRKDMFCLTMEEPHLDYNHSGFNKTLKSRPHTMISGATTTSLSFKDYSRGEHLDSCRNPPPPAITNNGRPESRLLRPNFLIGGNRQQKQSVLFPTKLRRLLDDAVADGNEHIISWLPDGKAFKIHDPEAFTQVILKRYFRQTMFKSFTRQL